MVNNFFELYVSFHITLLKSFSHLSYFEIYIEKKKKRNKEKDRKILKDEKLKRTNSISNFIVILSV